MYYSHRDRNVMVLLLHYWPIFLGSGDLLLRNAVENTEKYRVQVIKKGRVCETFDELRLTCTIEMKFQF